MLSTDLKACVKPSQLVLENPQDVNHGFDQSFNENTVERSHKYLQDTKQLLKEVNVILFREDLEDKQIFERYVMFCMFFVIY